MEELNKREIIESIKFFGAIVSTNGVDEAVKKTANAYLKELIDVLQPEIRKITAEASGIKLVTHVEEE